MNKRTTPTQPPPPSAAIAYELDQRADRIDGLLERMKEQAQALRHAASRLRGES